MESTKYISDFGFFAKLINLGLLKKIILNKYSQNVLNG